MIASPYFREWYRAVHDRNCAVLTGDAFEDYVASILHVVHDDFFNPAPAGKLGDRKCDGLADRGQIFYACYGSRPEPGSTEAAIVRKLDSDFRGACDQWETFTTWRFVTNARTGPDCGNWLLAKQTAHGEGAARPLEIRIWRCADLWNTLLHDLAPAGLDRIMPGAPGLSSPELRDLLPILDALNRPQELPPLQGAVREVPVTKMNYNGLSPARREEFNAGRLLAPRIDAWYGSSGDPDSYDRHGARFRAIYEEHAALHDDPDEIMEACYESLVGAGFRRDNLLANSAYAVASYFFDSCHIFREPPVQEEAYHVPSH